MRGLERDLYKCILPLTLATNKLVGVRDTGRDLLIYNVNDRDKNVKRFLDTK